MSTCSITSGIATIPCRDSIPGLSKFWVANYDDVISVDIDETTGFCSGITMASSAVFYEFNVTPDSSMLEQVPVVSAENGVAYWEQTLTATFGKMDAAKRNLAKTLVIGNFVIIALDKNGAYWLVGKTGNQDTGAYVNGGSMTTGTAGTDLSGLNLTFYARVLYPSPETTKTVLDSVIV